jgi:hypothetical protein
VAHDTGTGTVERLLTLCKRLEPVPTAVAHPCEASALSGAIEAAHQGLIVVILVGPRAKIEVTLPSAIWNFDSEDAAVLSFGTDSSLTVTPGWDNVTGYGEPNGLPFIQGVTGKTTGAPLVKAK